MTVRSGALAMLARVRSRDAQAAVAAAALVLGGLATLRLGFGPFEFKQGLLVVLAAWTVGAAGLIVWLRSPGDRVGAFVIGVAVAWAIANLQRTPFPPLNEIAAPLALVYAALLCHALAAFPDGRPRAIVWAIVALAYPASLLPQPAGALVVSVLLVLATGILSLHRFRARSLAAWPAFLGFIFGLTLGGTTALRWYVPGGFALDPRPAIEIALVATCVALAMATVTSAERRLRVTDLVVDLGTQQGGGLTRQLAAAIGDPTLEVAYALGDGTTYVDAAGRPVALPTLGSGRAVTPIDRAGQPIAVLIHDRAAAADAGVRSAITRAVELSGANARLQADVQRQAAEVDASRRRLLDVADEERRTLRVQLDEDLGPRLDELETVLDGAPMPTDRSSVTSTLEQLRRIRTEVEAIAEGLYPQSVEDLGLAGAMRELVDRSAAPVELSVGPGVQGALQAEAALYFVCSEALTNAEKHAAASQVRVRLARSGADLTVEIEDDGVGGADPLRGTGLRGLRERVEALGGSLMVTNRSDGEGTRIKASVPAYPSAPTIAEATATGSSPRPC